VGQSLLGCGWWEPTRVRCLLPIVCCTSYVKPLPVLIVFGWCALLLQVNVFCNCDVVEAEGSLSSNKSSPQTWFLKIMEFVASQHMLVVVNANHLPWWSDSFTWFLGFLSVNWLRLAPRCQLTPASVSFCFNSGVIQSTPCLSMLLL